MNKIEINLKIAVAIIAAGVLTSSNALGYGNYKTPATSYIHSGDKVILNKKVSTPAGAKIFLQNGKIKKRSEVRQASPYCYFHLRRSPELIDTEASLSSERFTVISTSKRYDMVLEDHLRELLAQMYDTDQDSSERTLTTRIFLESASQPEVIGLNCGVWAVPNERGHVTIKEIRKALGDVVTLDLVN